MSSENKTAKEPTELKAEELEQIDGGFAPQPEPPINPLQTGSSISSSISEKFIKK